jgi:hypothetical protein
MGRKSNAAKGREDEEWVFEEAEAAGPEWQDRTLVLAKEPLPRKVQLMAAGVKEIRCVCCNRIRPIAGAEELGEGWMCGDCLSDAADGRRYGG